MYIIVWTLHHRETNPSTIMSVKPQRRELTDFQKGEIVALSDDYSHHQIGIRLGIPHEMVSTFLQRFCERGSIENLPRPGAPRKTSKANDRYIICVAESTARIPLSQLRVDTNSNISEQTLRL